jgi:hypothetical protein
MLITRIENGGEPDESVTEETGVEKFMILRFMQGYYLTV